MLQKILILATGLSVLHNYFDSSTKLYFSDLHPAKISDLLAKLFFPYINKFNEISFTY